MFQLNNLGDGENAIDTNASTMVYNINQLVVSKIITWSKGVTNCDDVKSVLTKHFGY